MPFCSQCGRQYLTDAKFCAGCGREHGIPCQNPAEGFKQQQTNYVPPNYPNTQQSHYNQPGNQQQPYATSPGNDPAIIIKSLSEKENISGIVWVVIASLQVLAGVGIVLFDYSYFYLILVGAWNFYASSTRFRFSKQILVSPVGIYSYYEKCLPKIIIFMILNIFLGGLIGVAGAIYDLVIRNYAMNHKQELLSLEQAYSRYANAANNQRSY